MRFLFDTRWACRLAMLGASATLLGAMAALPAHAAGLKPVKTIADTVMAIDTPQGRADFPLYVSLDWNVAQPDVTRAVIVIHGKLRNADRYFDTALKAERASRVDPSTTLMIAPQFLATLDLRGHPSRAADLLRWHGDAWMGGEDAAAPAPMSSFAALDAIVARLADRTRFPNLRHIVVAGHSGGGQVVQRYAAASRDNPTLAKEGIDVRFLVANPSSYAYFDDQRPDANGAPAKFDAATCPAFDDWKYGMKQRPDYLNDRTPAQLEAAYATRHVTYLVGGNDTDPHQAALDRSCPAEAQGPQRMARGTAYFHYMQTRHPQGLPQSFHVVPGVGHDGSRMLTSACALAAMFGTRDPSNADSEDCQP